MSVLACAACGVIALADGPRATFRCGACQHHQTVRRFARPAPWLAFDLDGTVLDAVEPVDYTSLESVRLHTRPHARALLFVQALRAAGFRIACISGREEFLRDLTQQQLDDAAFPPGPLFLSRKWRGYLAMAHEKAESIRHVKPVAYVGDHDADEHAARLAGVAFVHARDLRNGRLPLPPIPDARFLPQREVVRA